MLRISLAGEFDSETVSALAKHVYPPQNRVFNFGATGDKGVVTFVMAYPKNVELVRRIAQDGSVVIVLARGTLGEQTHLFFTAGASDVVEGIPFSEEETINFFRELDEEAKNE